ncbi:MAG TPA: DUF4337 domain-containing protein [Hyphomicrobiaceae bacterium]|nr:DUF4337 domain-containing protein [Hyphomicrobiaceae bacterium]
MSSTFHEVLHDKDRRDKWIGVYIGILAVLLAVCGVGGGNASKDATRANIEAANTWNFFQAKNLRRTVVRLQNEDLELRLKTDAALSPEARKIIEEKIASYKALDQRLTSEPSTGEGLDELFKKGKGLEEERDIALRKDPYFDYSQALLQIAIVLATVVLIVPQLWLLGASAVVGSVGLALMLNAFTLAVRVPGIG